MSFITCGRNTLKMPLYSTLRFIKYVRINVKNNPSYTLMKCVMRIVRLGKIGKSIIVKFYQHDYNNFKKIHKLKRKMYFMIAISESVPGNWMS